MSLNLLILLVLGLLVVWIIYAYNSIVTSKNRADEAWSDIDVQLKRRYDLIPNLVETVKGYASHEAGTFQKVIDARAAAMGARTVSEHAQTETVLTGALKTIFALAEAYPDLKANQNFLEVQRELTDTENKVQAARRFYNGNARDLNIKLQTFPTNLIGQAFGFSRRDFFEIAETEKAVPAVRF